MNRRKIDISWRIPPLILSLWDLNPKIRHIVMLFDKHEKWYKSVEIDTDGVIIDHHAVVDENCRIYSLTPKDLQTRDMGHKRRK